MNQHHQNALKQYEDRFGLTLLKEIFYLLSKGENNWKMIRRYDGLEMSDLRYLDRISRDVTVFIHERENRQTLRLYTKMVA